MSADNTFSITQLTSGCRSVMLDIHLSIFLCEVLCFYQNITDVNGIKCVCVVYL